MARKADSIYIVTHPKFRGFCKIGRTRDIKTRMTAYNTACPNRQFVCRFLIKVDFELIKVVENYFSNNISNNKSEWFKISVAEAKSIISHIIENPEKYSPGNERNSVAIYHSRKSHPQLKKLLFQC